MQKLVNISKNQISAKGVQSLADRPNANAQYGVGGLSSTQLKLWFDKLASFLAEKINELQTTLASDTAADYIRIPLDAFGVGSLKDLVDSFVSGGFANNLLQVFPSVNSFATVPLQTYIYDSAQAISENEDATEDLEKNKLDKVTSNASYPRAYIIDTDGSQKVIFISEMPLTGAIPVFVGDGHIIVAYPTADAHAANKSYVDNLVRLLGSKIELSIDKSNYILTLRLKNDDDTVLSTAQVDLPLESTIIGGSYNDGKLSLSLLNGESIEVEISDIIDGLVNTSTYINDLSALNARIDETSADLSKLEKEMGQNGKTLLYAFYSEEAESARNYTKGGAIDRELRSLKKRLDNIEKNLQEDTSI